MQPWIAPFGSLAPGARLPSDSTHLEVHRSPFSLGMDLLDTSGRPVGELHASPAAQEGVDFELVRCPYSGTRLGRPMNASAGRVTARHHRDAVALLRAWRVGVCQDGWCPGSGPLDDLGAWGLSMVALARMGLLIRDGGRPSEAEATLHKVLMGVAALAWAGVVVHAFSDAPPRRTAAEWMAFAEQTGMLVHGGSERACAGAPGRMLEVFDVLAGELDGPVALWGSGARALAYGRAVRDLEVSRAVAVLRQNGGVEGVSVPDDWCGHLCDGLSARLTREVLDRLETDPRTGRLVRETSRRDPLERGRLRVLAAV